MKLLIIIPTYNEKDTIVKIIDEINLRIPHSHILVVDDNSPDGTADIVKHLKLTNNKVHLLVRKSKEGLGKAYIGAFNHIFEKYDPEIVAMMDADMSHHPKYLKEMEKLIDKGFSVVIGSRYVPGGDTIGWETWRKALSYFGNLYARIITGIPVRDLTAGFYMIDMSVLKKVDLQDIDSSGYAFQMEFKNLLRKNGAKFKELPIIFGSRIGGESKISNHIIGEGIIAPWKIRFKK